MDAIAANDDRMGQECKCLKLCPCRLCRLCHPGAMPKKKKNRSKPSARAPARVLQPTDGESRQSVAVTVAWMLSLLVTLAAELIAIPATILVKVNPQPAVKGISTANVADLFLFLALVTGLITVAMVPLVNRVRDVPPPRSVTIAALIAGAIPPITIVLRWLF